MITYLKKCDNSSRIKKKKPLEYGKSLEITMCMSAKKPNCQFIASSGFMAKLNCIRKGFYSVCVMISFLLNLKKKLPTS